MRIVKVVICILGVFGVLATVFMTNGSMVNGVVMSKVVWSHQAMAALSVCLVLFICIGNKGGREDTYREWHRARVLHDAKAYGQAYPFYEELHLRLKPVQPIRSCINP